MPVNFGYGAEGGNLRGDAGTSGCSVGIVLVFNSSPADERKLVKLRDR